MINEFDRVKIKNSGIAGVVVDIHDLNGKIICVVESDEKGCTGGYGSEAGWKLFDCEESELEKL
ncbi:MAG: hypothetical protein J6S14_13480 [Clostridia bacterium]|nr:hypothetical protein [Clostridia bacterium]